MGGDAGAVDQSEGPPTPTVPAVVAGRVGAVLAGWSGRWRAGVGSVTSLGSLGPASMGTPRAGVGGVDRAEAEVGEDLVVIAGVILLRTSGGV